MLIMSSVIVGYTFKNVFLTFHRPILQVPPPPNVAQLRVTYFHTLLLDRPRCVNSALINGFTKLTRALMC